MSDKASSTNSSDFSDSFPSTTTISTVAVQTGLSKIVLAVLRCGSWIRVRIQRMEPDLYEIGRNSVEANELKEIHLGLLSKLAAKQVQISELLSRADDMVTQQTSEGQVRVYAAMSDSLNRAWRDLQSILAQRSQLLDLAVVCFSSADDVLASARHVEEMSASGGWGDSVDAVRTFIEEHETLKRIGLLEPSHRMLTAANELLELLARMPAQFGQSMQYGSSSSRSSAEAREHVAAITANAGTARRHGEAAWARRARLLQLRLMIVTLESELERIVDWFVKVGEPRLEAAMPGCILEESMSVLDNLVELANETKEMQQAHTRLMRQLQQISVRDLSPDRDELTSRAGLLALPYNDAHSTGSFQPIGLPLRAGDILEAEEDIWRETQGAYTELVNRFRTSDNYIWNFLDRIEARRRRLHTSVIYFSEVSVLLERLQKLEVEIKLPSSPMTASRAVEFLDRLAGLEVRIPGLHETLNELRTGIDETISPRHTIYGEVQPPSRGPALSPQAEQAMSQPLQEAEDAVGRCRRLCEVARERDAKAEVRKQYESRIDYLQKWLHEVIYKRLIEHGSPGSTMQSFADFEDVHRRMDREMTSQERELEELKNEINRLSPTQDRPATEGRLAELISTWTNCRSTITFRLNLANQFFQIMRHVREDEYSFQSVFERLREVGSATPFGSRSDLPSSLCQATDIEPLRRELTELKIRLETQQTMLRDGVEQLTGPVDETLNRTETIGYCQRQMKLTADRLDQLRDQWTSCEDVAQKCISWRNLWLDFTDKAKKLDDLMASSLARVARSPVPASPGELESATREHRAEADLVNQLGGVVRDRALELAALVGARPADGPLVGLGCRLAEPMERITGEPFILSRVRSELCIHTAGLDTRWAAWERAWAWHLQLLNRRAGQLERLATIQEAEEEVAHAEIELEKINRQVSVDVPLERLERTEQDLMRFEENIPNLQGRVRSTAPDITMQLLKGPTDSPEMSRFSLEPSREVASEHERLSRRMDNLVTASDRCRSEINLTLRLLRAAREAENSLSHITMNLDRTGNRLHTLRPADTESIRGIRSEIDAQLIQTQSVTDEHVPTLQQIAAKFPTTRAQQRIQPIVDGFRDKLHSLQQLSDDVRVRSEQFVDMARLRGDAMPPNAKTSKRFTPPPKHIEFEPILPAAAPPAARPPPPPPMGRPPVIITPLKNIQVEEGARVTLETAFDSGIPKDMNMPIEIQGTWLKDGIPVMTPDYETQLNDHAASLTIDETFSDDTAQYRFCLKTPYGKAETQGSLLVKETHKSIDNRRPVDEGIVPQRRQRQQLPWKPPVEEQEAPKFVKPLRSAELMEAEPLSLDCRVTGIPAPLLRWYKDGATIDDSPDYVIIDVGGTSSVQAKHASRPVHEGTYVCRATNPKGEAVTTCDVIVRPAEPPSIVRPLANKQQPAGSRLELSTIFKGTPPFQCDWYRNGQKLQEVPGQIRTIMEYDKATLSINSLSDHDIGDYICVVRNHVGEASTSCTVGLRVPLLSPRLRDGELEELIAAADIPDTGKRPRGRPPGLDEFVEPSKAPRNERPRYPPSKPLSIEEPDSFRPYTFVTIPAELRQPRSPRRATSVPASEEPIHPRVRPQMSVPPRGSLPVFVQGLHNAAATEGQKVRLQCKVIGDPLPKVMWYKNGQLLPRSRDYRFEGDGMRNCLVFNDIFLDDCGEYRCVAENIHGSTQTSCHMDVEPVSSGDDSVDRPPELVQPLPRNVDITEGDSLSLECRFVGRPEPLVTWFKNGKQADLSPYFRTSQTDGTAVLQLPEVFLSDTGILQAVATNRVGSSQSTVNLKVHPVGTGSPMSPRRGLKPIEGASPEFTRIFKDTYIESEMTDYIRFECTVTGIPRPTVYWTFSGRPVLPEDHRFQVTADATTGEHTLTIFHPNDSVVGRYQAIAENMHGRSTCSAYLSQSCFTPAVSPGISSTYSLPRSLRRLPSPISVTVGPFENGVRAMTPTLPQRQRRETSAPPVQHQYATAYMQVRSRLPTPPIQLTFRLPRERSLSRSQVSAAIPNILPAAPQVKHASSLQMLNQMFVVPVIPLQETKLERRVASHPRLSPGYTSEEEHEHAMQVVPMVEQHHNVIEVQLAQR